MGQAVNTKCIPGLVLGPYPSPYGEVIQRACPICGKRTLTMDHLKMYLGFPRLLCCSCGAWGSAWYDEYSKAELDTGDLYPAAIGERAWQSLQNYGKRVADELIKDP